MCRLKERDSGRDFVLGETSCSALGRPRATECLLWGGDVCCVLESAGERLQYVLLSGEKKQVCSHECCPLGHQLASPGPYRQALAP